jgi:hypothetical protein
VFAQCSPEYIVKKFVLYDRIVLLDKGADQGAFVVQEGDSNPKCSKTRKLRDEVQTS